MGTGGQKQLCVYCASEPATTLDHVPPKLLLASPYPENLLTVPSCRRCNASFQADDEYTRFVISVDFRAAGNSVAQTKMPAILRSLERQQSRKFSRYLLDQMTASTVLGADGRPLGQRVDVDRHRINVTGSRMVRGLLFSETGTRLKASDDFRIASKAGIEDRDPAIQEFAKLYTRCPDRRNKEIGEAFSYVVGFHPQYSIWLLVLYDFFAWAATIRQAAA
jgi:hypothetical protein